MSGDDDRPAYLDREKKSFSELDRQRREGRQGRGERRQDPAAAAHSKQASKHYLEHVDSLFSGGNKGDAARLGTALLDARGTPGLADACRAYLEGAGRPTQARLASCFLDAGEPALVLEGLAALKEAQGAGALEASSGLRSQLRQLAEDPDDEVAGTAEDILEAL